MSRDIAVERTRMKDDRSCKIFTSYIPVGRIQSVPAIKDLVRSPASKVGVCGYPVIQPELDLKWELTLNVAYFALTTALLVALLASPAGAKPTYAPEPYEALYTVHANGLKVGEMTRKLEKRPDDTWLMESSLYTTGLVALFKDHRLTERSLWRSQNSTLIPLDFQAKHTGGNDDSVERMRFDWKEEVVTYLREGKETKVAVRPGILDKLLYQVALERDLSEGEKHLEYTFADRGEIKTYRFDVIGQEQLETPLGTYQTLKVQREDVTLWVAPALDYTLVQLVQEKKDYTATSYITKLERQE
ncbi:DUF3108 domain-containing protein [Thiohalomonas denitrificans]|uniref:DUF3108 domain-containing protein n=1 Tax=Thiohalomonas denitrificans TaxID=415747 RepID=UPI0026ED13C8|nr:DUF3108 domain-containing protein [Thiohalomonas denitrificans]